MSPRRHNPLLQILLINLGFGIFIAIAFVAGLLALDVQALARLILQDHSPAAALALLLVGFMVVFGSAAMGSAVMLLEGTEEPPGGRVLPPAAAPACLEQ